MFPFEKLDVYFKAKSFNEKLRRHLKELCLDPYIQDQLNRASLSIILNIAEGSGRITPRDQGHFFTIARGSAFECVSILDYLKGTNTIDTNLFSSFYEDLEEISKMLFAMIRNNRIKHKDHKFKSEWG